MAPVAVVVMHDHTDNLITPLCYSTDSESAWDALEYHAQKKYREVSNDTAKYPLMNSTPLKSISDGYVIKYENPDAVFTAGATEDAEGDKIDDRKSVGSVESVDNDYIPKTHAEMLKYESNLAIESEGLYSDAVIHLYKMETVDTGVIMSSMKRVQNVLCTFYITTLPEYYLV